jgi:hypothetical protein
LDRNRCLRKSIQRVGTEDTWGFPFRTSVATFQLLAGLAESLLNRLRGSLQRGRIGETPMCTPRLGGPDYLVRGLVRGVVTDGENKIELFRMSREQPLQDAQSRFSSPRPERVGVFGNALAGLARRSRCACWFRTYFDITSIIGSDQTKSASRASLAPSGLRPGPTHSRNADG